MPAKRTPKPRAERPARRADAGARLPLVHATLRVGFQLPAWRPIRAADADDGVEYRAARSLGRTIVATCQNLAAAPAGELTLDIRTPCDPNLEEGFPPRYATEVADLIARKLDDLYGSGGTGPIRVFAKGFPELGEVEVFGRFELKHEGVAPAADLVHTVGQQATIDARPPVIEEPHRPDPPKPPPEPIAPDAAQVELLDALLATIPKGAEFEDQIRRVDGLSNAFRGGIASIVQGAMNAHVRGLAQDDLQQKRAISARVNEVLARRGLAIRCRVTEEVDGQEVENEYPATLIAHVDRTTPEGRFRLQYKGPDGSRKRVLFEKTVPPLELMEATPRREALRFSERFAPGRDEDGRDR